MSYQYATIRDILRIGDENNLAFADVVLQAEMETYEVSKEAVVSEIQSRLAVFRQSVVEGLTDESRTQSKMSGGQAAILSNRQPRMLGAVPYRAMTYAIAVNEANAKMFKIVACPTAGSCGVVPGVLMAVGEEYGLSEDAYVRAFLTAAGIGNVVQEQACVAGAVGGCQAEVGTAAAMAAGAVVTLLGGTNEEVAHAMALSLKNILGLVCDPVAGLVEVPCVKRNGIYAIEAITAAEMAMAGLRSAIPADEVIEAMYRIGRAMPSSLRETSEGGLATTETGLRIAEAVRQL